MKWRDLEFEDVGGHGIFTTITRSQYIRDPEFPQAYVAVWDRSKLDDDSEGLVIQWILPEGVTADRIVKRIAHLDPSAVACWLTKMEPVEDPSQLPLTLPNPVR